MDGEQPTGISDHLLRRPETWARAFVQRWLVVRQRTIPRVAAVAGADSVAAAAAADVDAGVAADVVAVAAVVVDGESDAAPAETAAEADSRAWRASRKDSPLNLGLGLGLGPGREPRQASGETWKRSGMRRSCLESKTRNQAQALDEEEEELEWLSSAKLDSARID